jgi:hypothetical protein
MGHSSKLDELKLFLDTCKTSMLDIVGVCDSNGIYGGASGNSTGWNTAISRMMTRMYCDTCYSSGLFAFGEADSQGQGHGVGSGGAGTSRDTINFRAGAGSAYDDRSGIHASLSPQWDLTFDVGNDSGNRNKVIQPCYWASTASPRASPMLQNGITMYDNNPVGDSRTTAKQLQYQAWLAKFTTADAPSLTGVRFVPLKNGSALANGVGTPPVSVGGVTFATHAAASTHIPTDPFTFTYPVESSDVTGNGIEMRMVPLSAGLAQYYPTYAVFQRFVRTNATTGWASQMLYSVGGSRSDEAFAWLDALGQDALGFYLGCLLQQQFAKVGYGRILVWIGLGANDVTPTSAGDYKTYIDSIMNTFRGALATAGLDTEADLRFVICTDHPRSSPDDMADFRAVSRELAEENDDAYAIDLTEVTSYGELYSNYATVTAPCYDANSNVTDRSHLRTSFTPASDSYTVLGWRMAALIDGASPVVSVSGGLPLFQRGAHRKRPTASFGVSYKLGP